MENIKRTWNNKDITVLSELEQYFIYKSYEGLESRGLSHKDEYIARLEYELEVILDMGFPGYFLIVWDIVNYARENKIPVGPGRGSCAGSLVGYCLYIHALDPIKWGLLFERFLNPSRVSLPDIDLDFSEDKRHLIFEYVEKKYGSDKVAHIGTLGTLRAKAAVKATAKALGHPVATRNKLASLLLEPVHGKPQPLKTSFEKVEEIKKILASNNDEAEIYRAAEAVEGLIANTSIHACGTVISNYSLNETVPLFKGKNGEVVTQWEMGNIEDVGLVKFDFLGLKALSKIDKCLDFIEERHGLRPDLENLDLTDDKVYAKLRAGYTAGLFQLEGSSGITDLLVKVKPSKLEDVIAVTAIYRPGPLASPAVQDYLDVRAGLAEPIYLEEDLRPILEPTDGLMIFQEQTMKVATDLAGYSLPDADSLRKAIGKKKEDLMAQHEQKFKDGWIANGYRKETAEEFWKQLVAFAAYGFNKSHAAAYTMITYQMAWLKTYYPVEFITACIIVDDGDRDAIIKYISEAKRLEIQVLAPSINTSRISFLIEDDSSIRFGLGPIKNLGKSPVQLILSEREQNGDFISLLEFCQRVDLGAINRLKVESLIKAGAFDGLGHNRNSMLHTVDSIWEHKKQMKSYESKMQTYMKKLRACLEREMLIRDEALSSTGKKLKPLKKPVKPPLPEKPEEPQLIELSKQEYLKHEMDLLGFFVSGHPLDRFQNVIKTDKLFTIDTLKSLASEGTLRNNEEVALAAVCTGTKEITTSAKKQTMSFGTFEDTTGSIEGTLFPYTHARYKSLLEDFQPVKLMAKIQIIPTDEEATVKLIVNKVEILKEPPIDSKELFSLEIDSKYLSDTVKLLDNYKGSEYPCRVIIKLNSGYKAISPNVIMINNKAELLQKIQQLTNGNN